MNDERARVEAWMGSWCYDHNVTNVLHHECPDCLLAFAAAQRAEEREACLIIAEAEDDAIALRIARLIRARREGPG